MKKTARALATLIGQPLWTVAGFSLSAVIVVLLVRDWIELTAASLVVTLAINAAIYGLALLIVVGVAQLLQRHSRQRLKTNLGISRSIEPRHVGQALLFFAVYFATTVAVSLLGRLLLGPWVNFDQDQEIGFDPELLSQVYEYVIVFVALVILPPVFEELLFRGYLFGKLRGRFSFIVAALVSSITFGLIHGQINVAIDTFVLGMFLAYLRESTGAVWASMILHGLKNGLAYFLLFIAPLLGWSLVQ